MWCLVRVIAVLRGSNNGNGAIVQRLYGEGGTEETWAGGGETAPVLLYPPWILQDISLAWCWSSMVRCQHKNELQQSYWCQKQKWNRDKVIQNKGPWGKHRLELIMPHKIWEFFCYVYCFSSPHLHTHILLCSWIVGWKQQVVCQSEHEQQHLLWTYNALGRVRIAFYRGSGQYFVLHVWKWLLCGQYFVLHVWKWFL
jgi:hypothetical protein